MQRVLAIFLVMLAAAVGASAQSRTGLAITSPSNFTITAGRETGLPVGQQRFNDRLLILEPTFSWIKSAPRTEFFLTYKPEFEIFERYKNLNAWNHTGFVRLAHRFTERFTWLVGDSYLATQDPSRKMMGGFLLPRSDYKENVLYSQLQYNWDPRTSVRFRYDNTYSSLHIPGAVRLGVLDLVGNNFSFEGSRLFGSRQKLEVEYSILRISRLKSDDPEFPFEGGAAGTAHNIALKYKVAINPGLLAEVSGGIVRRGSATYSYSGHIEKRLGPMWVAAGYRRSLAFYPGAVERLGQPVYPATDVAFASGLLPNTLLEGATVRLYKELARSRFGFDIRAAVSKYPTVLTSDGIRSFNGGLRLNIRLFERLIAVLGAETYRQNLNEFIDVPMRRNRVFGGLEVQLSDKPRPVSFATRTDDEQETGRTDTRRTPRIEERNNP